jgi:luciferase family oxidoreductase group 1
MLPNHAPLVVAEQFGTLEALHPGRIDLGLGRAPGTDMRTARALRHRFDLGADHFPEDVVELIGYLASDDQPGLDGSVPGRGYLPEVWLLGSSLFSAELAGVLGLPYSFAYHFAPRLLDEALARYRSCFETSVWLDRPRVMVAASVLCAPGNEEARWLSQSSALSILQLRTGRLGLFPSPEEGASYPYSPADRALVEDAMATHVIGDPGLVRAGLAELEARTEADEIIISTRAHSYEARSRSLELVAEAWALSSPGP